MKDSIITEKNNSSNQETKLPHLLKFMGSKREILDFVTNTIKSLDVRSQWFCDLMAGTGIVSGALKSDYNIHANDIQRFSAILSNTYLLNIKGSIEPQKLNEIKSEIQALVEEFKIRYPELKYNYDDVKNLNDFIHLEQQQQGLIEKNFEIGFHLFTKYYSGTYWSFEQCLWIDSIRAIAERYKRKPEYYTIISSLIYAMSYNSQSTGHYAQYRDAKSESSMMDILNYRKKNIWDYFEKKFNELIISINGYAKEFRITNLDYLDCLRIIEEDSIVYVDPPYQSVHYSRFYHTLETLVRYDYPKVLYKGRYRDDRHQSPFSIRTKVEMAFEKLFSGVKDKRSHLVLSYSDTGMITLAKIKIIADSIFKNEYKHSLLSIDHTHSSLGRNDKKDSDVTEYLIIYTRK